MPRTNEQSYRAVAEYLKGTKKGATVNDIVSANLLSKASVYRLFRPEMFTEMAMYGIVPINDTKPYFFAYNARIIEQMIAKSDRVLLDQINENNKVVVAASEQLVRDATILSPVEKQLIDRFRDHCISNPQVDWAKNFSIRPFPDGVTTTGLIEFINGMQEPVGEDVDKLLTILISIFVASKNQPEGE